MRIPIFGILFLLLPILEIATIILIGNALGLWATLALLLGTSLLGIFVLRWNATKLAKDIKDPLLSSNRDEKAMIAFSMRSLGGILLILPGFICKTIGAAFLLPPLQHLLWQKIGQKMTIRRGGAAQGFRYSYGGPQQSNRANPTVVDLDDDDFERHPNENSPWFNDKGGDNQKRID